MTPKEAEIRLRIMVALMPLSINDKKCQPVIDDLYKIFELSKCPQMSEALKGMESLIATGISSSLAADDLMEFLAARDKLESLLKSPE